MKIGLVILCRFSSSRLPGKILKPLNGKPLLTYIWERCQSDALGLPAIVATSNEPSDDPIEEFCMDHDIPCFRGDLHNVAERFLKCAQAQGWNYAIRINGDNLFVDHQLIQQVANIVKESGSPFVSNVKGRTYPFGMSVEAIQTEYYAQAMSRFSEERFKEHVTLYFYEHEDRRFQFATNTICPEAKGLHLAIDTPEDFKQAAAILECMERPHTEYTLSDIYRICQKLGIT